MSFGWGGDCPTAAQRLIELDQRGNLFCLTQCQIILKIQHTALGIQYGLKINEARAVALLG